MVDLYCAITTSEKEFIALVLVSPILFLSYDKRLTAGFESEIIKKNHPVNALLQI